MPNLIKLIAVDIDGTLLNSQHQLTARTEVALRQAAGKGVEIVVATGKSPPSVIEVMTRLGLGKGGVYIQGLLLLGHDGQTLYERSLDADIAHDTIRFARDRAFTLVAYSNMQTLAEKRNTYTDILIPYREPVPDEIGRFEDAIGKYPLNKFLFIDEPDRIITIRPEVTEMMHGRAAVVQALPNMLEVLPHGASKGDGLQRLLEFMQVPPESVLAIGDGENDIEMIQLAGIGVAMGNANAHLKQISHAVVASNNEDGVGEAIERFVLNV